MKRLAYLLVLIPFTLGCGDGGDNVSVADAEAVAAGVGKEKQVAFFLTEELGLSSIGLTHTGQGHFTGKGSDSKGTNYEILVEQAPGEIKYSWRNSHGREGSGSLDY